MKQRVSQATSDAFTENGSVAPGVLVGTMSVVLLMAACIIIVMSRLPPVRQYNQAMATEIAVVPSTYTGNDCPPLSPTIKKNGRCHRAQRTPRSRPAHGRPTRVARRGSA